MPFLRAMTVAIGLVASLVTVIVYFTGASTFRDLFAPKPTEIVSPHDDGAGPLPTTGSDAKSYYYIANTLPPDNFLSLRSEPTVNSGHRLMTMANGTLVQVLRRQDDGWWQVRVYPDGPRGWALSNESGTQWIVCCRKPEE